MATLEGPEVVPHALPPEAEALRQLFLGDYDKCHCKHEIFDMELDKPPFYLEGPSFKLGNTGTSRIHIPLRLDPLTLEDFRRCFIEVAPYVDDTPLVAKDLNEHIRVVPSGSDLPGIEIPGLPFPLTLPEPAYTGQYIQNYSYFGLFLQPHCLSRAWQG